MVDGLTDSRTLDNLHFAARMRARRGEEPKVIGCPDCGVPMTRNEEDTMNVCLPCEARGATEATGALLDNLASNVLGIVRDPGETDASFRHRIQVLIDAEKRKAPEPVRPEGYEQLMVMTSRGQVDVSTADTASLMMLCNDFGIPTTRSISHVASPVSKSDAEMRQDLCAEGEKRAIYPVE